MHAVATLVAIEALLLAVVYLAARRDWPRACLYLLAMTAPLELYRTTIAGATVSLFRMSLGVAAAAVVLDRMWERRIGISAVRGWLGPGSWLLLAYAVLAAVVAVSLIVRGGNGDSVVPFSVPLVLVGMAAIAVVAELTRRMGLRDACGAVVAGATVAVLAGIWQVLAPKLGGSVQLPFLDSFPVDPRLPDVGNPQAGLPAETGGYLAIRMKGAFADANHFGACLVFGTMLTLGLTAGAILRRDRPAAAALGGLGAALTFGLVATYSRSAWGAMIAALVVAVVLIFPRIRGLASPRQWTIAIATAGAVLLLVLVPLGPVLADRIDLFGSIDASDFAHKEHAVVGVREFRANPVFGLGVGALGSRLGEGQSADSTYLTVAADLGVVGLFALLLTAGAALQALWRAHRSRLARPEAILIGTLIGAYVGFLAANVVYDGLWWRDFHFLLLGLILAIGSRADSAGEATRAA